MPVVAEPEEVSGLAGLDVRNVQGGRAHAAAVLNTGEVLTWGCGHSGKLGHGAAGSSPEPTRYFIPPWPPLELMPFHDTRLCYPGAALGVL